MKNIFFLALLLTLGLLGFTSRAQQEAPTVEVTYQTVVNGKTRPEAPRMLVLSSALAARSWTDKGTRKRLPGDADETSYIDFAQQKTFQVASFADGKVIHTPLAFSEYPVLEETGETALILGYTCKKVKTSLRSNAIEIWYTTDLGVKGTPAMAYGIPDGLVLKVVRNGNYEISATEVKPLKKKPSEPVLLTNMGPSLDAPLFRHRITENLITTVDIFTREQISFGNEITNPADTDSEKTFKYSSGTVILRKVKLPVVPDDTQLFVELYQHSNGDAYDRTGSVFLIPQDKEQSFLDGLRNGTASLPVFKAHNGKNYQGVAATPDFSPLVEIMRFFTSFGVGQFNEQAKVYGQQWEDSTLFKQDVSDLLPLLQGERWIGVFIGNYDKGGHRASLKFRYYPGNQEVSDKPARKYWSMPLFNTLNVMEMSGQEYGTMFENDSLRVQFTIPKGVKNIQLRCISTGHGGWGGGDEFNQKVNTLWLDNILLFQFIPWRSDCATFRSSNPASGNFWNGLSSSDYSRSGWCPGTATNPVYLPLTTVQPGTYHLSLSIPLGKPEGGSFSAWNVSAILLGEYE